MRRLAHLLVAGALVAASAAFAQEPRVWRIGGFAPNSKEGVADRAVVQGALRELGYVEGRNVVYLAVDQGADRRRLAGAVEDLLALKPDVVVAWGSDAGAVHARTKTVPIVLYGGFDPVGAGLANSLARPGKNVTGVTQLNERLPAKHVEILAEFLPRFSRLGMLFDETAPACALVERSAGAAARRLGKSLVIYKVASKADIVRAFAQMENDRPDALMPCPSPVTYFNRELLFSEGLRLRIPWTSYIVKTLPLGVLFAHSSSRDDELRKAATYVDRILKGANPAELPIEQPSRFELVVSLKTAKALGIEVPQSILLRADRVIE